MNIGVLQTTKSTLVIGGGGFVGANLVPLLMASGRNVTVIGRRSHPRHELPKSAAYLAVDFGDSVNICELLDSHDEIVHLAYATVPNTSFKDPLADLQENLTPTVRLFAEIAKRGRKLVLVSSGGTVYGEAKELPISEDHPTLPISPYGLTKLTLENYARLYATTHGLKFICVRPSNAYGAGQQPFVGQGFISTAMAHSLRRQPICIFGEKGTVRDYIHVKDLARGIFSALENGILGTTYNIGSGLGLSNIEVLNLMRPLLQEIGCNFIIRNEPERLFDVHVNILDSNRLMWQTGWKPTIDIVDGLRSTRDWLIDEGYCAKS